MTGRPSSATAETRFTPAAWLVMAFALFLLLSCVALITYRFTLPTDGWSVYVMEVASLEGNWIFDQNLVGVPSDIQPGDTILAVEGISLQNKATTENFSPPPNWQIGKTVTMQVHRGSQQLDISVPVVHWTLAALWRYNVAPLEQAFDSIGTILLLALGWFTFLRRPAVPAARALLLFTTCLADTFISGMLPDGLSVQFNLLAFGMTAFFSYMIFGTVLAPSILAFALLFPKPKQVIQRHPWLSALPFVYGLLLFVFLALGGNGLAGWISTLAMFLASIVSLIHSGFTQRDAVSRAQLRWGVTSFVVGLGLFTLTFPVAFHWVTDLSIITLFSALANLGFAVIGVGLSVAVLRYHLFDIDIIIRRTLQYLLLSGLLALVYFGCVVLLQVVFRLLTGDVPPITIVISTLSIAALFNPLRYRVQEFIDRRFFRSKYNAEQILANFADSTRNEVELGRLSQSVIGIVEETVQPERVSLWLRTTGQPLTKNIPR